MLEQGEDIEGFLVDSFLNRVNQEFQPYAQSIQTGQLRPTKTSTTQSERERLQLAQLINKKPIVTSKEEFESNYEELLDRKFDYVVQDGKLLIGESGTKKLEISLNDPNFKSRFAKYAKLPPGIGQQQLTEEQINARASQLLSNAGL